MSEYFNSASSGTNKMVRDSRGQTFAPNAIREFLPEISPAQIEKISGELHGMIGQRIVLSAEEIVQVRRAVNVLLQDAQVVLTNGMSQSRIVALLSSEPAICGPAMASLKEGGATHLAMNIPKAFQPILDTYQATGIEETLAKLLKARGFKHPLALLGGAASLGIKLVAVGDQACEQAERKSSSVESIALDLSTILDQDRRNKVILWAGSQYLKRSKDRKLCNSSVDYLALNYSVFSVHNGNYLIDGGPLRKIVFDLQCPGAIVTGRNRVIDNLATGIDYDHYGDWNAILMHPRPALDFSYFITND